MSEHRARVHWTRDGRDFDIKSYSRNHSWQFDGEHTLPASAAAAFRGDADRVDPEQGFAAALAACHMLTFLAIAATRGLVVDRYEDEAIAVLGRNDKGRSAVTEVVLNPTIHFAEGAPDDDVLDDLHQRAHRGCFLANAVRCKITVKGGAF